MFDEDGNGTITLNELKSIFENNGTKKEEQLWVQIMKEVDTNNDGLINFGEFVNAMTRVMDVSFVDLNRLQETLAKSFR